MSRTQFSTITTGSAPGPAFPQVKMAVLLKRHTFQSNEIAEGMRTIQVVCNANKGRLSLSLH